MFTSQKISSINKTTELPDGLYLPESSIFVDSVASTTYAMFTLYRFVGTDKDMACDLVFVLSDGALLARDFLRLSDGSWRDSYGLTAAFLPDLLPPELFTFTEVETNFLESFNLINGVRYEQ